MDKNFEYRILFAEDVSTDREIVERILKQNEVKFVSECVDTEPEFKELLQSFHPHLILSDYQMPTFNGMRALKLAKEYLPDVPFVVITGSTNEDIAVDCMKQGADDYVIKQNLKRLIPSIKSAIQKKKLELRERQVRKELEESELKYRLLIQNSPNAIAMVRFSEIVFINKQFELLFGYTLAELNESGFDLLSLFNPKSRKQFEQIVNNPTSKLKENIQTTVEIRSKSGKQIFCEITAIPFSNEGANYIQAIIKDISLQKELSDRNALLSRAIGQSPVGVVITNESAEIEYANSSFLNNIGYSADEVIGKNPKIFSSGQHNKDFYDAMWATLDSGNVWIGEIINKKNDGDHYPERLTISPIYNSENNLTHYIAIKEDISEQKKYIADLQAAKKKAEESDKLKSAFLASMNHELRTPLNHIIGFSDLIQDMDDLAEVQYFSKQINKSGSELLEIIEDIFSLALMEQSRIQIKKEKVFLRDILVDLKDVLRAALVEEQKENTIKIQIHAKPKLLNHLLIIDRRKVVQAISNILRNAVKYTHKGTISLHVEMSEENLVVSCKDSGIGIAADKTNIIFDFFRQGDESFTKQYGGVGIGLALSKKLIHACGGNITVKTELGAGSEFTTTIPVKIITSDVVHGTPHEVSGSTEGLKVLIAEDHETSALLLNTLLKPYRFNILHAENGEEAVNQFHCNKDIGLILMDLHMPGVDGFEATKLIRNENEEIPIIAVTAFTTELDRQKALAAGCSDIITKPIKKLNLFRLLDNILDGSSSNDL